MGLSHWAALLTVAALALGPAAAPSSGQGAPASSRDAIGPGPLDPSAVLPLDDTRQEGLFPATRPSPRRSFFRDVSGDFKRFFSTDDTLWTVGTIGVGALVASSWDRSNAEAVQDTWSQEPFGAGKVAGNVLTHLAFGGGSYLVGRVSGHDRITALGADLMRAQILSQAVIQAGKFAAQRERPDASNHHSLPSGHAATAFATATIVQRHYGWTAGIPAYAFASYVGASRMASNRHYFSDVLLGAGIGIAAAHTVTIDVGSRQFDLGVSPSLGGAAVTFTKR
jgi:membrane-associated phospholipid phosphatase